MFHLTRIAVRCTNVVTVLLLFTCLVACQQDQRAPNNSLRSVVGAPQPNDTEQDRSTASQQEGTQKRGQYTDRTGQPGTVEQNQTRQTDQSQIDLSELQSVRERNRKIKRRLNESKNEWPDKFDQQARGRLEQHMQKQGWSDFDYTEGTEERTSDRDSSGMDHEN